MAATTERERVFWGLESGLRPARRGLMGRKQFELGQISWSLPRWRQEARQETERSPLRARDSGLIWGIPAERLSFQVVQEWGQGPMIQD